MVTKTQAMRDTVDQARISSEEQRDRLVEIQKKRNDKLKFMNAFEKQKVTLFWFHYNYFFWDLSLTLYWINLFSFLDWIETNERESWDSITWRNIH